MSASTSRPTASAWPWQPPNVRGGALRLYDLPPDGPPSNFQLPAPADAIACRPGTKEPSVAFATLGQGVILVDGRTGRQTRTSFDGGYRLAWSPDGRLLAVGTAAELLVHDLRNNRKVLLPRQGNVSGLAFSRSGAALAATYRDQTVVLWDHVGGRRLCVATGAGGRVQFGPGDRMLGPWVSATHLGLWQYTLGAGQSVCARFVPGLYCWRASFHPEGRLMAGLTVSRLELWDVEDERPAAVLPGSFSGACFDPTAGDLFTTQRAEGLRRWPVRVGAAGAVEVGPPEDLGVRPDPTAPLGNPIAGRGGRVIVTATTPTELAVLDRDRAGGKPWNIPGVLAEWPALSRDGRWLACLALDGPGVALWDLEGRRKVRDFPALGRVRLAFSPDGKRLERASS